MKRDLRFPDFAFVSRMPDLGEQIPAPPRRTLRTSKAPQLATVIVGVDGDVRILPKAPWGASGELLVFTDPTTPHKPSTRLRGVARFIRAKRCCKERTRAGGGFFAHYGEHGVYAYTPGSGAFVIHNRAEVADLLDSIADDWEA